MKRVIIIATLLFAGLCTYAQKDSASIAKAYKDSARTDYKPKGQLSYEQSIAKADMAFAGKDYLVAKRFYKNASTAKPAEAYPKTQIDACDKKMNSDSWISTELNCPCNKGKVIPFKGISNIYDISSDDSVCHAILPGKIAVVEMDSSTHTMTVIVKHGKYQAIYSNLTRTWLKHNDEVKEGDEIGQALKQNGSYVLKFSFWQDKNKEDAMSNVHCK